MREDPQLVRSLEAVVQCLEAEYRALLAEDFNELDRVLRQKEALLSELAQLPAMAVGRAQGDHARTAAPWKRAFERVSALNKRNAMVLVPRAAANRARLHFLQSALGRAAGYGADGAVAQVRQYAGLGQSA